MDIIYTQTDMRENTLKIIRLLLKVGSIAIGLVFALLATLRELFSSVEVEQNEERRLHDSDTTGEYNYRTGRLDAGTDPYGWYGED